MSGYVVFILLIAYMTVASILLINLLIAMFRYDSLNECGLFESLLRKRAYSGIRLVEISFPQKNNYVIVFQI